MELDLRLLVTVDERVLGLAERLVVALERLAAGGAPITRDDALKAMGEKVAPIAPLAPLDPLVPSAGLEVDETPIEVDETPIEVDVAAAEAAFVPVEPTPAGKRRAVWTPEMRAAQAARAREWHRKASAIPPAFQTRDGGISTAALEEARVGDLTVVPMTKADAWEWARRWAPDALVGGGRIFEVAKRISNARKAQGLPGIRLVAELGTRDPLPAAGLEARA